MFYHALPAKYKTTLKDLQEANPGVDPRRLRVGYKLVVPSGTALLAKKPEPAKNQVTSDKWENLRSKSR
jgi:LysM repeat protein